MIILTELPDGLNVDGQLLHGVGVLVLEAGAVVVAVLLLAAVAHLPQLQVAGLAVADLVVLRLAVVLEVAGVVVGVGGVGLGRRVGLQAFGEEAAHGFTRIFCCFNLVKLAQFT